MRGAESYRGAVRNEARARSEPLRVGHGPGFVGTLRKLNRSKNLPFASSYDHAKIIAKAKERNNA